MTGNERASPSAVPRLFGGAPRSPSGQPPRRLLQGRMDRRKRNHQKMLNGAKLGALKGLASDVIELLDDDDDKTVDVIDLCAATKPPAIRGRNPSRSMLGDGEVEVLEGPPDAKRKAVLKDPTGISHADTEPPTPSPVLRVLEIFPDVEVAYVQKKLREQDNNFALVVAILSESDNYPKEKKRAADGAAGAGTLGGSANNESNSTIIRGMKTREPMHDYSSPAASFEISRQYRLEVISLLMYDFCFLKKNAIQALLEHNKRRYTLTRNHIHDMIVGKSPNDPPPAAAAAGSRAAVQREEDEQKHYQLLRSILVRGSLPRDVRQRMGKSYCMNKPRKKIGLSPPPITDPVLADEHLFFESRFRDWLSKIQDKLRGQAANLMALENGSAVRCNCCFDDVAISECVPCKEKGHLFCKDCIVQYVESQVFGSGNLGIDRETMKPALEIKCCEGSGCNSGFPDEMLQKVLPPKTWEKYSEMQAKAHLERAGLGENLAMCPKCGYQAEVPEMQNVFSCPVEGCRFVSCRKCGKAAHIPLRCEEVLQQNRRDEGRLKIEEALSEAKMRTCPKCHKKFIKSDGCNKMTCACGMKMCYVCRKPLDKMKGNVYSHFCQVPHCDHSSCGKCKLYSNNEEDDALAMREAGIAAKEAFEAKVQTEDGEAAATDDLKLNVEDMMKDPTRPSPKRQKSGNQHRRRPPHEHPRNHRNNRNGPHHRNNRDERDQRFPYARR